MKCNSNGAPNGDLKNIYDIIIWIHVTCIIFLKCLEEIENYLLQRTIVGELFMQR
jgi:hypothetical protein